MRDKHNKLHGPKKLLERAKTYMAILQAHFGVGLKVCDMVDEMWADLEINKDNK